MPKTSEELARDICMISVGEVALLKSITSQLPHEAIIVNLGAGVGTSGLAFVEARGPQMRLYSVDKKGDALQVERDLIEQSGHPADQYEQIQGDALQVGRNWSGGKIDLLFVDDYHGAEHVKTEIEIWERHLSPTAWIIFHDYGTTRRVWRELKAVVDAWARERGLEPVYTERIMACFCLMGASR